MNSIFVSNLAQRLCITSSILCLESTINIFTDFVLIIISCLTQIPSKKMPQNAKTNSLQ